MEQGLGTRGRLQQATMILLALAGLKLLVHWLTAGGYGYFRDELYYLAAAEHLDFGYVDIPPLVPVLAALTRWLLGSSLPALHFLPALAGAVMVYLGGRMARELGGGRLAQIIAALAILAAPIWLGMDSMFTYDAFDQLMAVLFFGQLIRILKQERPGEWLKLGLIAGIGLMTKLSLLFLIFGLAVALVVTPRRRMFLSRGPWLAAGLALLIITPYLVWQQMHGWPLLEYWRNYALYKTFAASPLQFLLMQILTMNPVTLPFWLAGLWYLLRDRAARDYRVLGLMYLILLALFMIMHMKFYLLTACYFPLLAAGGTVVEQWAQLPRRRWLRPAVVTALICSGILLAPNTLPVLPIPQLTVYFRATGNAAAQAVRTERWERLELPQHFADRFGWEELTAVVARVYRGLTPHEQRNCAIFAGNYGEAGAIDFFGPRYHLPKAICNHNSYHIWGPGSATGEVVIALGVKEEELRRFFGEVREMARTHTQYGMYFENNLPVYLCRRPKLPIKEFWPGIKKYN